MNVTLSPYLNFAGSTREAMEFYKSVLGGELTIQSYGESGQAKEESEKDLVMHAVLKNDQMMFMASDGNKEHPVHMGDNIQMSLSGTDEGTLTTYFNGLAEDGKVDFPLAKQFWGDTFGMLTDKFGVHWMVNISSGEQK
jgi:PhnB protein